MDEDEVDIMRREVAILKLLDHPNIIRIVESYEDRNWLYLVMSYCHGGTLLDRLKSENKCRFSNADTASVVRQIVYGLAHVHSRFVCHRDLKLENILLAEEGLPLKDTTIVIIDFGLSADLGSKWKYPEFRGVEKGLASVGTGTTQSDEEVEGGGGGDGEESSHADNPEAATSLEVELLEDEISLLADGLHMYTFIGTFSYMSPELISHTPYTLVTDMWSLGVICYMLLFGHPPFRGKTDEEVQKNILKAPLRLSRLNTSKLAREFIRGLLCRDSGVRMTADDAMRHEWLRTLEKTPSFHASAISNNLSAARSFLDSSELRRVGLFAIASTADIDTMVARDFNAYTRKETGNGGVVTLEDFRTACGGELSDDEVQILRQTNLKLNAGESGFTFTQFFAVRLASTHSFSTPTMQLAFEQLDLDKSGFVTSAELHQETALPLVESNAVLHQADTNGDGKLSFEEFVSTMSLQVERDEE